MSRLRAVLLSLPRVRALAIARVAALAAIGVAVVLFSRGRNVRSPSGPAGVTEGPTTAIHLSAPDFRVASAAFAGSTVFVLSQHTTTPTIIYGMAAWCGSCIQQATTLVTLKREFGDRLNLVVVDIDPNDTEGNLHDFAEAAGGPVGIWTIDRDGTVVRPYHIGYLHTTIVIRDGRELSRVLVDEPLDRLRALVSGG